MLQCISYTRRPGKASRRWPKPAAITGRFIARRFINTPGFRPKITKASRFLPSYVSFVEVAGGHKALWQGLINDAVSTTATDEFPTTLEHKLLGKRIDNVTGGNLGAEARMGIVYTEGVVKRGMTLPRFAEVTSTNAARIWASIHARE